MGIHTCRFLALKMLRSNSILGVCLRITVPIFYEDAHGDQHQKTGDHFMLLPHEIMGAFHDFPHMDLMVKLIGGPGVSWKRSRFHNSDMVCHETKWLHFSCLQHVHMHVRLSRSSGRTKQLRSGIGPTQFFR